MRGDVLTMAWSYRRQISRELGCRKLLGVECQRKGIAEAQIRELRSPAWSG